MCEDLARRQVVGSLQRSRFVNFMTGRGRKNKLAMESLVLENRQMGKISPYLLGHFIFVDFIKQKKDVSFVCFISRKSQGTVTPFTYIYKIFFMIMFSEAI